MRRDRRKIHSSLDEGERERERERERETQRERERERRFYLTAKFHVYTTRRREEHMSNNPRRTARVSVLGFHAERVLFNVQHQVGTATASPSSSAV